MGKFKEIDIKAQEAWAKVGFHNEQFRIYKHAAELYGDAVKCQHVIDYHDRAAYEAECLYVDLRPEYMDEYLAHCHDQEGPTYELE